MNHNHIDTVLEFGTNRTKNPFSDMHEIVPHYVNPGQTIGVKIENRSMEMALIKLHAFGIETLEKKELNEIYNFIDSAVLSMKSKNEKQ